MRGGVKMRENERRGEKGVEKMRGEREKWEEKRRGQKGGEGKGRELLTDIHTHTQAQIVRS
jgi:hypothetical protein